MSDHSLHWQPGVEEIVAREVAKALREAADDIAATFADPDRVRPRTKDGAFATDLCNDAEWAEQIVRDRAALAVADAYLGSES